MCVPPFLATLTQSYSLAEVSDHISATREVGYCPAMWTKFTEFYLFQRKYLYIQLRFTVSRG
jgi:hypothetical protein